MLIKLIRNATLILKYHNLKFLVDPMLGEKGTMAPFPSEERADVKNPLVELPVPMEELLLVDAVLVTHLHPDHFDREATRQLPKDIPVFVQSEHDKDKLSSWGFEDVRLFDEAVFHGVTMHRVPAQHGYDPETAEKIGIGSGIVLSAKDEQTLYLTGDTVWYDPVKATLDQYRPKVIVASVGGNALPGRPLIMDEHDLVKMHEYYPKGIIIACHMEALNHWVTSRETLRKTALMHGFDDQLIVLEDGEFVQLLNMKIDEDGNIVR
ncbi:MAG: MBL fold metallo-hydrolase [Lachnospiraceae bacterium]|nr:MBL fold metallo-hydrolase [Lachnospiraceae bacterium]